MVLDPLSTISLASNIVTFIEFGSNILTESRRLYQGTDSSENLELASIAGSLRQFCDLLKPTPDAQGQLSGVDKALPNILKACKDLANELLQAVQHLDSKDARHKKWKSFRHALSSIWQKEKLSGMQSRLDSLRDQVTLHLVASVR